MKKEEDNITLLLENLDKAINLYQHEDNLNWTKFNMLVTFQFALITAFYVLFIEKENLNNKMIFLFIVILLGYYISYLFMQKIKSGIHYMLSHKNKIKKIEEKIYNINKNYVSIINIKDKRISCVSKTVNLLKFFVLLSFFIWSFALFLVIYSL